MFGVLSLGLFLVALVLWLRWRQKKFCFFKDLGIPGPPPSILFGNLLEMMRKDPMTCQKEWIEKYGDVVGYYYGSWPAVLLSSTEHLKKVLIKDFSVFSDRPSNFLAFDGDSPDQIENQHMINLKGKKWKEVRNMLTPTFTTGKLKQMLPLLNDSASIMMSLLDKASNGGTKDVEMFSLFQGVTLDAISRSAFGLEASVQNNPKHPLLYYSKLLLDAPFKSLISLLLLSFREFYFIIAGIRKIINIVQGGGNDPLRYTFNLAAEIIQMRKDNPSSRRMDLLQTIIDAKTTGEEVTNQSLEATAESEDQEDVNKEHANGYSSKDLKKLTDIEITANALLFFIAGYETTSTSLAYLAHNLMLNSDVQDKVRKEIFSVVGKEGPVTYDHLNKLHYTDLVIMESQRMYSTIYNFQNRISSKDYKLDRWNIPAGTTIQIPTWAVHYNPDYYEDPYTFNPDRFHHDNRSPNHSVIWQPFGAGPRNCIGMRFALMEMKLIICKIIRAYRLEPSEKSELGRPKFKVTGVVIHPAAGIHLKAIPV